MSDSMIERVARALARSLVQNPKYRRRAASDDEEVDLIWREFIGDARAAIEAMRVPTEAMVVECADVYGNYSHEVPA